MRTDLRISIEALLGLNQHTNANPDGFCQQWRHCSSDKQVCMQVVGLPTLRMSKDRDLVVDDGNLVIPRNTTIWIPLGLPHASSAVYQDAGRFLPERWLEPDAEYMPTNGTGCFDRQYALLQTPSSCIISTMSMQCYASWAFLSRECRVRRCKSEQC